MKFEYDIDFIIGYLDQSKKMNYQPDKIVEILIFLLNQVKEINERSK